MNCIPKMRSINNGEWPRDGATNCLAETTTYSIRGKNPCDGAVRGRLISDVNEEFRSFAWRNVQHET